MCLSAGLYFGREVSADSEEGKLPLHGPNQWPSPVSNGDASQRVTVTSEVMTSSHQPVTLTLPAPACADQRVPVTSVPFILHAWRPAWPQLAAGAASTDLAIVKEEVICHNTRYKMVSASCGAENFFLS